MTTLRKQPMEDEDYASEPGSACCPFCESDNWDFHNNLELHCLDCNARWVEVYKLVGYDPVRMPDGWRNRK